MSTEKNDVIVVSVEKYTFKNVIENNFYAFPQSYNRKIKDYIAFYRVSPISKVTHYAKVQDVKVTNNLNTKYRLMTFGDKIEEKATVVKFEDACKLDPPTKYNGTAIQGALYTTLDKLKNASVVSDLK